MKRLLFALFIVFAALPASAQVADSTATARPTLRQTANVSGDLVRIGDLIDNAGELANVAIFRAPDPGQTGTVRAASVIQAALARGLVDIQADGVTEVIVTRDSRVISLKDIEAKIARALAERTDLGTAESLVITLDRSARPIQVEPTVTADLQIARQFFDPRSGRFDITFDLPGSVAARVVPLRYTGRAVDTVDVAILQQPVGRGEIINPQDITLEKRPKREVAADAVTSLDQLAGMAARNALRPGHLFRAADLMKPQVVKRTEAVVLVYRVPGMLLTVRGVALQSGAVGDVVDVLNPQSKRKIQGVVSAPNQVDVTSFAIAPVVRADVAPPTLSNLPRKRIE